MNRFGKSIVLFQPFDVAKVCYPSVNVLKVKHFEDRIVLHVLVEFVHNGAFCHDGIANVFPFLEHKWP